MHPGFHHTSCLSYRRAAWNCFQSLLKWGWGIRSDTRARGSEGRNETFDLVKVHVYFFYSLSAVARHLFNAYVIGGGRGVSDLRAPLVVMETGRW